MTVPFTFNVESLRALVNSSFDSREEFHNFRAREAHLFATEMGAGIVIKEGMLGSGTAQISARRQASDNGRDAAIDRVGLYFYKHMFEGWLRKKWGRDPKELEPSVAEELPVSTCMM